MCPASYPSFEPNARGMIFLAFRAFATLKYSSQVVGGWSLLSAKTFLLYQRMLARWMLTGTPQ